MLPSDERPAKNAGQAGHPIELGAGRQQLTARNGGKMIKVSPVPLLLLGKTSRCI